MRTIFSVFITVLLLISCKTKTTIDPPPVEEIEEAIKIEDDYEPLGNDQMIGQVKGEDNNNIQGVAIKLTLNKDSCVNAYSDFDGKFILLYDKTMIQEDSKLEILYEGYAKKTIAFKELPEDNIITLDKKGDLVKKDQYKSFHESIRSCTR